MRNDLRTLIIRQFRELKKLETSSRRSHDNCNESITGCGLRATIWDNISNAFSRGTSDVNADSIAPNPTDLGDQLNLPVTRAISGLCGTLPNGEMPLYTMYVNEEPADHTSLL